MARLDPALLSQHRDPHRPARCQQTFAIGGPLPSNFDRRVTLSRLHVHGALDLARPPRGRRADLRPTPHRRGLCWNSERSAPPRRRPQIAVNTPCRDVSVKPQLHLSKLPRNLQRRRIQDRGHGCSLLCTPATE